MSRAVKDRFSRSIILAASLLCALLWTATPALASTSEGTPANITVGAGATGLAYSPDGANLYVANMSAGTVSVIDTSTSTVTATVNTGTVSPAVLSVAPDGDFLYIASYADGKVAVVNTTTHSVVSTLSNIAYAMDVEVSSDGLKLYVVSYGSNSITVYALNNGVPGSGVTVSVGANPSSIALSPDNTKAYVVNNASNTLSEIDTSTNTVTRTIPTATNPWAIAASHDGERLAVSHEGGHGIDIFDLDTMNVSRVSLPVRSYSLWFSPDSTHLYSTEFDSAEIRDTDVASSAVVDVLNPIGASGLRDIVMSPDGCQLATAGQNTNQVYFYAVTPCLPNPDPYSGGAQESDGTDVAKGYLASTGSDTSVMLAWAVGGVFALAAGASILILRRRASS